jgi:undecaprenyl-diphosphatase
MDAVIVFCAKYLLALCALALLAYGFLSPRVNRTQFLLQAALALALAYALARLAGFLFSHEQPFAALHFTPLIPHDIDNSFPSDHAALAGALAGVASLYNRTLGSLLWVLAVAVAAGRMLAGLHYPIDVVAGLVLGGLAAAVAGWAVHKYFSAAQHT